MNSGLIILLCIFLSAFFSGMEIAFVSANKLKVELDKQSGKMYSRLLEGVLESPAKFIAQKENSIIKSYNRKVANGMKPELAYLDVLSEEIDREFLPTLDTLVLPKRIANIKDSIGDNPEKFFEDLNNEVLESYKQNKTASAAKNLIEDLDKINFFRDIFYIRQKIGGFDFAVEPGKRLRKSADIKIENLK